MEFQLKWTQTGSYEKLWLQIYEGLIPDFAVLVCLKSLIIAQAPSA